MTFTQAQLSLDVRLFFWWDSLPPGTGVTMEEMQAALGVYDAQTIRNALVRLRKGEVRDPSSRDNLVPKPIRYDSGTGKYYDFSKVNPDLVASQVPRSILARQITELLTRAMTLQSAMGEDGLALSARQYLQNAEIKELIAQLPTDTMWGVHSIVQELARARHLLAIEEATRPQLLSDGEKEKDES